MPRTYREIKKDLLALDSLIYDEHWPARERSINQLERSTWLLASARRQLLKAILGFYVTILGFSVAGFIYHGVAHRSGPIVGTIAKAESFYFYFTNGGSSAIVTSAAAILLVYAPFASLVKSNALFRLALGEPSTGSGSFRSEGANLNLYVLLIGFLAAAIFGYVSSINDHTQIGSWWQTAIAGGVSGLYVQGALEKLADAINVARAGTIERRHSGGYYDPRRYTL